MTSMQKMMLIILLLINSLSLYAQKIDGKTWKDHFTNDLLPYWDTPDAFGTPIGNFPTFRCNDGTSSHCRELEFKNLDSWILEQTDSLRRNFTRTQSRQIMFYAIAYHITGEEKFLYAAKCGVNHLHDLIHPSGLIYPYQYADGSKKGLDSIHITTQDLACSVSGLAFYYYITHDQDVLTDILRVKDYVFKQYRETDGYIKWTLCKDESCPDHKTELAAYLDQINSYLLLITPLIENKAIRDTCIADLAVFCKKMKDPLFFNAENSMMWAKTKCKTCLGTDFKDPLRKIGVSFHTDFGQSSRTYWNLYLVGKLIGDSATCKFAYTNGLRLLKQAYLPAEGAWASSPHEKETKRWWLHSQLDQAAALFSLSDTSLNSKYLNQSYTFWMEKMVDKKNHEVFAELDKDNHPVPMPKIYHWKDALHPVEHFLFGYIVSSAQHNQTIDLYFAYNKDNYGLIKQAKPFYFDGEIAKIDNRSWSTENRLDPEFKTKHSKSKISFVNIKDGRTIN